MRKYLVKTVVFSIISLLIIIYSVEVQAQEKDNPTNKGILIIENGLDFTYDGGSYYKQVTDSKGNKYSPWSITLNPSVEYFTFNMIAFGGTVNYIYQSAGADTNQTIGFGPIVSFYYGRWITIIPYISITATYQNKLVNLGSNNTMHWADRAYVGGAKLGVVFMVSRQVGLFIEGQGTAELHKVDNSLTGGSGSSTQIGYSGTALIGVKAFIF